MDLVSLNPVDKTVAANNDLSNIFDSHFRHNSPQAGLTRQPFCGAEYPVVKNCRHWRCIAGNEQTDRLEVVSRLRRPSYLSHFAMRSRISS